MVVNGCLLVSVAEEDSLVPLIRLCVNEVSGQYLGRYAVREGGTGSGERHSPVNADVTYPERFQERVLRQSWSR